MYKKARDSQHRPRCRTPSLRVFLYDDDQACKTLDLIPN